jgi:hypothetical protein
MSADGLTLSDPWKRRSGEHKCTDSNFLNNYKATVANSKERRESASETDVEKIVNTLLHCTCGSYS